MLRRLVLVAITTLTARSAEAADCDDPSGLSPCFDAEGLWLHPVAGPGLALESARLVEGSSVGAGLSYAHRPVTLLAHSPDPEGRAVEVIGSSATFTVLFAERIPRTAEIGFALPLMLHQTGAGFAGATSQRALPVPRTAPRDPRLHLGVAAFDRVLGARTSARGKFSMLLALPLGDETALAGDVAGAASFGFTSELALGTASITAHTSLRLRGTQRVGSAHLGPQLVGGLGASVEFLGKGRLSAAIEAWAAPVFVSQELSAEQQATFGELHITEAELVPAEWLASVASQVADAVRIRLGAGTALPLSTRTLQYPSGERSHERFSAITSPAVRGVVSIEFTSGTTQAH